MPDLQIVMGMYTFLTIVIPFLVIVTFNLATITLLCRNRFRQHTVPGNRDHMLVFTKITIMTGVSFVISYFLEFYSCIYFIFDLEWNILMDMSFFLANGMMYFNSCMNPIICLVVCRSMQEDIQSFLMAVIQRVRGPCASRCWNQEYETENTFPMATMV